MFTPEQLAAQARYKAYTQQRESLKQSAGAALAAELALPEPGSKDPTNPCLMAYSTADWENCQGQLTQAADANLSRFRTALKALLTLPDPTSMPSAAPGTGFEGPAQTPEQAGKQFDQLEMQWSAYAKVAEKTAFDQFDGGTGAGPFAQEAHLHLVRSHMQELGFLYGDLLSNH